VNSSESETKKVVKLATTWTSTPSKIASESGKRSICLFHTLHPAQRPHASPNMSEDVPTESAAKPSSEPTSSTSFRRHPIDLPRALFFDSRSSAPKPTKNHPEHEAASAYQ
jgi:hypothetical protein